MNLFLGTEKVSDAVGDHKVFCIVLSQTYNFMHIEEESCEINLNFTYSYFMESQEKFKHKNLCPLASSLPSPCIVCLLYASSKPPPQQEYPL